MTGQRSSPIRFRQRAFTVQRRFIALRIGVRTTIVVVSLFAIASVASVVALAVGDVFIPFDQVMATLGGGGTRRSQLVVLDWRLPRVLGALLLGACLALSGSVFQSLTRNPLGSPDIIGFSSGSYTGALLAIILGGGGYLAIAGGALVGGIATPVAGYAHADSRGVQGFRLIVVGIGVAAVLGSVNTLLIVRADLDLALQAAVWGAGSLTGIGYDQLLPVALICAVLIPAVLSAGPTMRQLELGDDAARASGIDAERARLVLMVLGVALTAVVTAAAGPIAFVALVAPQIARRLTGGSAFAMVPSAALGAVLLLVADVAGQRLFAPSMLPVGIMTVSIGGFYFVWLLVREARKG
jgi:iron complex transport system permease protein